MFANEMNCRQQFRGNDIKVKLYILDQGVLTEPCSVKTHGFYVVLTSSFSREER